MSGEVDVGSVFEADDAVQETMVRAGRGIGGGEVSRRDAPRARLGAARPRPTEVPGSADAVLSAMRQALGAEEVGHKVDTRGITGQVERIGQVELLVHLTSPVPGLLAFVAIGAGDASARAVIGGYLFSEVAPGYVEREQPAWQAWLESLDTAAAHQ